MSKTNAFAGLFILFLVFIFWNHGLAADQEQVASNSLTGTWISILPPLTAIAAALIFRQVLLALFLGIWMGAFLHGGANFGDIGVSFFQSLSEYILPATADADHMSVIIFTLLIGGIVGVITDNGGTRGIIKSISGFVKTKVQGQLATSLMGFIVFFDDYANTMVVGNTMRPLTDKLKISRAKLAYLVDSTAAPVATVALVSTWIGAMVGFISDAESKMPNFNETAYSVFLNSLPYNFYAFLTIFFVLMIAGTGKDFGAMLKVRVNLYKAAQDPKYDRYNLWKNKIEEDEVQQTESHWSNAVIPIILLVFGTIAGLFITGEGDNVQSIIETADSYRSLMWGSLAGLAGALLMTKLRKIQTVEDMLKSMMSGMHTTFDGLLVLVLAWGLSTATVQLGTADFLVSVFGEALNPYLLPAIILVISGITAFATGSSWGTMGILMPLVVPLAWQIGQSSGLPIDVIHQIIYASVSSVLAGSVWGDHCSPISDTTILSSIASQCDHVEHVNTQLPYALTVGAISIFALIGVLMIGIPWWLMYAICIGLIAGIIFKFGKTPDPSDYESAKNEG